MLHLWNTLYREKREFKTLGEKVRLYTCGPTVYDSAHIGNLRSYLFADILRRALLEEGHSVDWVMNLTDVDDKTIKKTIAEFGPTANVANLRTLTDRYIKKFNQDLEEINIPLSAIRFIRVADQIPAIVSFIEKLIEKGFAYQAPDGSTYFSIQKYEENIGGYGELVGKNFLEGKKVGARVKVDDYDKENLSDFALWKSHSEEDAQIFWDGGTLGNGRPGWHIECSVINHIAFEGHPIDIHTGGIDLIFPHHVNEIAQSEPLVGKGNFVQFWCHSDHLQVDGKKMAKRENNFVVLDDLKSIPFAGRVFRYLALQTHYRSPMNFRPQALEGAYHGLSNLYRTAGLVSGSLSEEVKGALQNDLNTSEALAAVKNVSDLSLLGLVGENPKNDPGLIHFSPLKEEEIPEEIKKIVDEREKSRASKQFTDADTLRNQALALGYVIEDSPSGPVVRRK